MAVAAPFDSVAEADAAYFGDGGGSDNDDGDGGGGGGSWNPMQREEVLDRETGWTLAYQQHTTDDRRRWFVIRNNAAGDLQALRDGGTVYTASDTDEVTDLPNFESEPAARRAYNEWVEDGGDENSDGGDDDGGGDDDDGGDDDGGSWKKWQRIREAEPWFIFSRTHETDDRAQFMAVGKTSDGDEVYLADDGSVVTEPNVFGSMDALDAALAKYRDAVANGEIPEGRIPTGETPDASTVRETFKQSTTRSATEQIREQIRKVGSTRIALAAIAVIGVWLYVRTNGGEDLE